MAREWVCGSGAKRLVGGREVVRVRVPAEKGTKRPDESRKPANEPQ